ncbi:MAG: NUDIX hydrolase [bacterium]|nr:NUDIX hydrolase [bacterium]
MKERPQVGLAVFVIKDKKILMHKRKNAHGDGTWSLPGGHLEFCEGLEDCALRETFEESGVKIKNLKFAEITNDIFESENKHYVTIFMIAEHDSGKPMVMEPEKCERWEWFEWENMPSPLFLPIKNLLKKGYHPLK